MIFCYHQRISYLIVLAEANRRFDSFSKKYFHMFAIIRLDSYNVYMRLIEVLNRFVQIVFVEN